MQYGDEVTHTVVDMHLNGLAIKSLVTAEKGGIAEQVVGVLDPCLYCLYVTAIFRVCTEERRREGGGLGEVHARQADSGIDVHNLVPGCLKPDPSLCARAAMEPVGHLTSQRSHVAVVVPW